MKLNEIYKYQLKTGEIVMFKTDMISVEVKNLPTFSNQYKFSQYFRDRGNKLEIYQIIKQPITNID